jgi:hypothetical protein
MLTDNTDVDRSLTAATVLALGIVLGGFFIGNGFARGRSADRYVEVKGLSEREVTANLALWPLRFAASDNDLAAAQAQIKRSEEAVFAFLENNGIAKSATEIQSFQVTDLNTQRFRERTTGPRFIIEETLMVRLDKPEVVQAASQKVSDLVSSGVVLSSADYGPMGGPTFIFNGLNALKPKMIAEATASARAAAEQFAADSGSSLGGIRQANQGVFVILPRDQAPGANESAQIRKIVRVVSTVQYFLE